jgi:hypothetical protein
MGQRTVSDETDEPNVELERLEELVRQAEALERELEEQTVLAAASGTSQRDLAAVLGTSKSSINRRLSPGRPSHLSDPEPDEEEVEFRRAMRAEQIRLAKLRVAKEGTRLQIQQDQAALIREANDLTRFTESDLDI